MAKKKTGSVSLSDSISHLGRTTTGILLNIVEFAEHPQYLGLELFPVQKVILKLIYNLPLGDCSKNPIVLKDEINEITLYTFNHEQDFVDFLYQQDLINSTVFENVDDIFLICGRRASKSTITSIISSYTVYTMLQKECPQDYFKVAKASEISIAICSNSKKNAGKNFREIDTFIARSKFFKDYVVKNPSSSGSASESSGLTFKTKSEVMNGDRLGRLVISTFAVNPSVRGGNNIITIMDEFAHFLDSELSTKENPLDEVLWDALTPSTSGFVNDQGIKEGKNIVITSPNGKKGRVWRQKELARDDKSVLFINLPSHWINPRIPSSDLRKYRKASQMKFEQEYLARFVSKIGTAISNPDKFIALFDPTIPNDISVRELGHTRYMAIDQAFSSEGDAYSISVCHFEPIISERHFLPEANPAYASNTDVFVYDYIGRMISLDKNPLDIDKLLDFTIKVMRTFRVKKVVCDQYSFELFEYVLKNRGMRNLEVFNATQESNSNVAKLFKNQVSDGKILYPYVEDFKDEMLGLTERVTGKFIKIENTVGHDDQYSSSSKAMWICHQEEYGRNKVKNIAGNDNSNMFSRMISAVQNTNFIKNNIPNHRGSFT